MRPDVAAGLDVSAARNVATIIQITGAIVVPIRLIVTISAGAAHETPVIVDDSPGAFVDVVEGCLAPVAVSPLTLSLKPVAFSGCCGRFARSRPEECRPVWRDLDHGHDRDRGPDPGLGSRSRFLRNRR